MAEERKNKLLESPLYAFVTKGWVKWSQKIVSLQAGEEDFLLYLVWALDTIKEQDDGINAGLRDRVYTGLRDHFISQHFASNKLDLDYLTNLVCAAALACFGLTLTDSQENQKIYSELVSGFGEHWKDISDLKSSADMDTSAPELKEWALAYMASEHFSTYNDVIDWNNDDMAEVLIHRAKSFEKIDLYRVIMALIEIGAFESVEGNLTKKKVFKAFADMLGDNFDDFQNNLSAGSKNKNDIDIFDRLKSGFEQYEAGKDEKLEKQGKPKRR
jgi:hypothetical protein